MDKLVSHWLLALFVAISLSLSPAAVSASANTAMDVQKMVMADDMPCCPKQQAPDDCQQCPMMIVCMSSALSCAPVDKHAHTIGFDELSLVYRASNDANRASLGLSPPARPPRTSVISA
jgi:hypothetical protein